MKNNTLNESLLEFPCSFPIKIMGFNHPDLLPAVTTIVTTHYSQLNVDSDINIKLSTKGNYLSITVTIIATSKAQLDAIYLELNKHYLVKVTL